MNRCNNCAKFLTCNRQECKQITFLQAGQLDKLEVEHEHTIIDTESNLLKKRIDWIWSNYGTTKKQLWKSMFYQNRKYRRGK